LIFGTAALILPCEQCEIAYIDNVSYAKKYAKYSPGILLYHHYLKELSERKHLIYLGDGEYEYKAKYSSVKKKVYDGTVYRNSCWKMKLRSIPLMWDRIYHSGICAGLRRIKHFMFCGDER